MSRDARAAELITMLGLSPHPEGGFFREIHRASAAVVPDDGRGERAALTTIWFLLGADDVSRWHRVASDEVWHFVEGDVLELHDTPGRFERTRQRRLGSFGDAAEPVLVVPSGNWQAARTTGAYTLVACTVGPGFDFADFEMLRDLPAEVAALQRDAPHLGTFV